MKQKTIALAAVALMIIVIFAIAGLRHHCYVSEASFFPLYQIGIQGQPLPPSELDEIRSAEFLMEVSETVGSQRILGCQREDSDSKRAARIIGENLVLNQVEGGLVHARFWHRDPEVCKSVLEELLMTYYRRKLSPAPLVTLPSITITQKPTEPTSERWIEWATRKQE